MWANRSQWSRLFNNRTAPLNSESLSLEGDQQREIPQPFVVGRKMDSDDMDYVHIVPFQNYDLIRVSKTMLG